MKLKDYKHMLIRPFIVYADFESSLVKINDPAGDLLSKHVVNSACYDFVCSFDARRNDGPHIFHGVDCVKDMIRALHAKAVECVAEMRKNKRMVITETRQKKHDRCKSCYLCKKPFTGKNWKVRGHDHLTGNYRGAAQNSGNINCFHSR